MVHKCSSTYHISFRIHLEIRFHNMNVPPVLLLYVLGFRQAQGLRIFTRYYAYRLQSYSLIDVSVGINYAECGMCRIMHCDSGVHFS